MGLSSAIPAGTDLDYCRISGYYALHTNAINYTDLYVRDQRDPSHGENSYGSSTMKYYMLHRVKNHSVVYRNDSGRAPLLMLTEPRR